MTDKVKRRKAPEPGRPFTNRKSELHFISEKLKIGIEGKSIPSVVTCFWGAYGMGKSWLLRELARLHGFSVGNMRTSYPCITVRLDLDKNESGALWTDDKLNRELLVQQLWRQIAEQISQTAPAYEKTNADGWASNFVHEITKGAAHAYTPLIMLDTLDYLIKADEPSFDWLETHIVEPLAITDRVLFVFTSRGEIRHWKKFQVRRRADSRCLGPFEPENIRQQLETNSAAAEFLHRIAFGHPLLTDFLATELEGQKIDIKKAQESEWLETATAGKEIFHEVIEQILSVVHPSLHEITRYANMLRWLSVESLRYLLENLEVVEKTKVDMWYQDKVIDELQEKHLLYWNFDKNRHEPDTTLRKLFTYDLWLNAREKYVQVHETCFDFHKKHLTEHPQFLAKYVPELFYHFFSAQQGRNQTSQMELFGEWWEKFQENDAPKDVSSWDELYKTLEDDKELASILPAEVLTSLKNIAKNRS